MRTSVLALLAALCCAIVPAQDSRPATVPDDPAARLLAAVDARIYSAEGAGLKSIEFAYRPVITGPRQTNPFRVHVRWEKGQKETVDFQKPDGTPFAELPEILRPQDSRESYERGARGLLVFFRGVPYTERYAKWRKRLEIRTVNGREEKTIICDPVTVQGVLRDELSIDPKDLPWRIVSFLAHPEPTVDRMIDEPVWTEFDGKLVMTSFKKTRGASFDQISFQYQRKDGFIVPASFERTVAGKAPERTLFEDIKLGK